MASKQLTNRDLYKRYVQRISVLYTSRTDVRSFAEILLSFATATVFIVFAIRPTLSTIAELYSEIQGKKETLELMETKVNNLIAAQKLFEQQRVRISILNQAIPNQPLVEKQIRQIEGLAKANNVFISGLSTKDVVLAGSSEVPVTKARRGEENVFVPPEGAQYFPLTIEVTGGYQDIMGFLRGMENIRRPILSEIVSMRVGRSDSSAFGRNIQLNIDGIVSYLTKNRNEK